jgi:hypothetical protein
MRDAVQDLAWNICEETTWVLPAHEEQGPGYWDLTPPRARSWPLGAHTMLTREPDTIDLFCAETGAALAETVTLVGDQLVPEVRQRIRHEVERRIFKPYLAYARDHWWFKGPLNWNGVCNGSIGLAFLRLEDDLETLTDALSLVLEGFEAYIATGFEADGGSIEGVGYWNYGLMYYVTVAELLRELSGGALDLLAQPRLRDIAVYPVGMALVAPDRFINFGDSTESTTLAPGIANRLAERTGVNKLRALFAPLDRGGYFKFYDFAKLVVSVRNAVWWDASQPCPALDLYDYYLPHTGLAKFVGRTAGGKTALLAVTAGHNDGHHSHTDVASFVINIGGESLLPDPGRGLYSKDYFRQQRYANVFNNSYSHAVPRIGGQLQAAGPEFGGHRQYFGTLIEHHADGPVKAAVIDFHTAYALPTLTLTRRTFHLETSTGIVTLTDEFAFEGDPLDIEEAFSTWFPVSTHGNTARIQGEHTALMLQVIEPVGAVFSAESLHEACQANQRSGILTRLAVNLPSGTRRFVLRITPLE